MPLCQRNLWPEGGALRRCQRTFASQVSGGIAVAFALVLPVLLGILGLCADYMNFVLIRTELQAAVDGAAMAGAHKLMLSGVKKKDIDATIGAFLDISVDHRNGDFDFKSTSDLKTYDITVQLQQRWSPLFSHVISAGITPIMVEAKAKLVGTANICVLALHPSSSASVHLTMLAKINANNCAVYANSNNLAAIRLDLMGQLRAGLICSAGGTFGLLSHFSPPPMTDCPPLKDPLASLPEPGGGACDYSDVTLSKGSVELTPGVYCGGLTIKGSADVSFAPGSYVIRGGAFSVTGKASVKSSGTDFYLQGDKAVIDFRDKTTIELSGQETGPMAGLLFFEDRSAPTGRTHLINSANARQLTGTVYLSRGKLVVNPNAPVAPDSAYTAIVARTLQLTEGPTLVLNTNYDLSPVPVPEGIRASSRVILTE